MDNELIDQLSFALSEVLEINANTSARETYLALVKQARETLARRERERATYAGHITQARAQYCNDDCEIDDEPYLSVADEGVWVSAWVWVANGESQS